jgi:hypothetical protein
LLERISLDPKVMVGKPVVRGTRLTVDFILGLLAQGETVEEILAEYGGLSVRTSRPVSSSPADPWRARSSLLFSSNQPECGTFDAISVYDQIPGAEDSAVIELALRENRILVTNDQGFGERVFRDGRPHRGGLLLH